MESDREARARDRGDHLDDIGLAIVRLEWPSRFRSAICKRSSSERNRAEIVPGAVPIGPYLYSLPLIRSRRPWRHRLPVRRWIPT
jgi:hypothetical protein